MIESLYNAINRHEIVRAYSYWGTDDGTVAPFKTFSEGYRGTVHARLVVGDITSDGAAGSIYFHVPVAVRTVNHDGSTIVAAGCYTVRQVDPKIQGKPPFTPLHIVSGKLLRAKGHTSNAVPTTCRE
ncbi:hypothetical protein [Pararhizobium mangrovi]|uniref:SnoaL-like domain-containing protein n=1 Tax=Pararhizobium mangrovi TaxID=2590452 RepID=A0A506UDP4_9HYPH|nr:hypothetical protein [Pararhizobium mangrovi]TPW31251.1 hypothetical protein FJU11_03370 [Pararhizobium mangrovi]